MWSEDDDDEPEEAGLDPALLVLHRFAAAARAVRWFSALGTPLDAATRTAARTYLDVLGFPDADVAEIADFADAATAAESLDWDNAAWEAEESLRAELTDRAVEALGEAALTDALVEVRAVAGTAARIGADEAAAAFGESDETLINAAVGAAIQACHQAALVLAAGADDDHPFAHKFRLFEAGRWPVGVTGLSLNLF